MAALALLELTIHAELIDGAITALHGKAQYRVAHGDNPEYTRDGAVDVTDLLTGATTLAELRNAVTTRIQGQV